MTITAEQREERRKYIGSSDIAAILQLDPFRGPYDVYLEKVVGTDDTQNEAMAIGDMVEAPLVRWAAESRGVLDTLQVSPPTCVHPNGVMAANFDALSPAEIMFEAKYSSQGDEWGDEDTDQVPDRVITQCNFAMACMPSLQVAFVPAFITRGNRITRSLYTIERNRDIIGAIEQVAVDFMENNVRLERPPADVPPPSWDTLKRVRREEDVKVHVPDELVERWIKAREERLGLDKGIKKAEEEAKNAVIAAMGKATVGLCNLGEVKMTKVNKREYTVAASSYWRTVFKEGK